MLEGWLTVWGDFIILLIPYSLVKGNDAAPSPFDPFF